MNLPSPPGSLFSNRPEIVLIMKDIKGQEEDGGGDVEDTQGATNNPRRGSSSVIRLVL